MGVCWSVIYLSHRFGSFSHLVIEAGIVRAKCDFCPATAYGTRDELIDKLWARAVISAPVRMTITACPLHHEELKAKMIEVLGPKWKHKRVE